MEKWLKSNFQKVIDKVDVYINDNLFSFGIMFPALIYYLYFMEKAETYPANYDTLPEVASFQKKVIIDDVSDQTTKKLLIVSPAEFMIPVLIDDKTNKKIEIKTTCCYSTFESVNFADFDFVIVFFQPTLPSGFVKKLDRLSDHQKKKIIILKSVLCTLNKKLHKMEQDFVDGGFDVVSFEEVCQIVLS